MIDIVIVSYHRAQFTYDCLCSIKAYTETPHRVIVVDNGSDEETVTMLQECEDTGLIDKLVLLPKNLGLEPAKNIGLTLVKSDMYVDSDNDILLPPPDKDGDWLSKLISLMSEDYAAIALPPQVFIGANKQEMFKNAGDVLDREFVGGSMRLMRTEAVREVGGWRNNPKDMVEANRSEEHFICGKLRAEGYKVGYATNIPCFHLFGNEEDGPWGYKDVEHYHRPQEVPTDKQYGTPEQFYSQFDYEF